MKINQCTQQNRKEKKRPPFDGLESDIAGLSSNVASKVLAFRVVEEVHVLLLIRLRLRQSHYSPPKPLCYWRVKEREKERKRDRVLAFREKQRDSRVVFGYLNNIFIGQRKVIVLLPLASCQSQTATFKVQSPWSKLQTPHDMYVLVQRFERFTTYKSSFFYHTMYTFYFTYLLYKRFGSGFRLVHLVKFLIVE